MIEPGTDPRIRHAYEQAHKARAQAFSNLLAYLRGR